MVSAAARPSGRLRHVRRRVSHSALPRWSGVPRDAQCDQRRRPAADQIDHVNAHGMPTPVGDIIECTAIKRTFGEHAPRWRCRRPASMTGHLLGGAGGTVLTVLVLGQIARPPSTWTTWILHLPTWTWCPTPPGREDRLCLSNSFGFGGTNGV